MSGGLSYGPIGNGEIARVQPLRHHPQRAEAAQLARASSDVNNNQPPMSGVLPDYAAPIVTKTPEGERQMRDVRSGPVADQGRSDMGGKRPLVARSRSVGSDDWLG